MKKRSCRAVIQENPISLTNQIRINRTMNNKREKMISKAALFALMVFTSSAHAVIFGVDDRQEVGVSARYEKLSESTATMVSPVFYALNQMGLLDFTMDEYGKNYGLCSTERFFRQPVTAVACSGFLVAPDILVTA